MESIYVLPQTHIAPENREITLENCIGKTVLVIGSGGREHAIVDALSRSPQVSRIYCAPGNAGIGQQAFNVPLKDTDVEGLLSFARDNQVDLTVVGPEASLAAGVVDAFRAAGLAIFGHTRAATAIESSKEFAKELMGKYGIPTAAGVVIAQDLEEARAALASMLLDEAFGKGRVVIEDFLTGPEFSFLCFVDGERVYPMPLSQDHKRAFDGDKGPNTGGMGAYTGLPFITEEDRTFAYENILCKAAAAMAAEGRPLSGVLYGGLMKTPSGIKVIEFNARFGDPETEVVLPLLESDIYDIFEAVATGRPAPEPRWRDGVTLGVVLASKGYPGHYDKGFPIAGTESVDGCVYHMGTAFRDGQLVTAGGRVLMVVAGGTDVADARERVYRELAKIHCDNLFHRNDIAHCALEYHGKDH